MSREYPFGYPQHPPDEGRVSVADMSELIHAGLAVQLFPEFNVGPTFYDGVWWFVPQGAGEGARGFMVADEALAAELTSRFEELAALDASVARTQAERRAAREAGRPFPDVPDDPWDYEPNPVDTNPFTNGTLPPDGPGSRRRWWPRRRR